MLKYSKIMDLCNTEGCTSISLSRVNWIWKICKNAIYNQCFYQFLVIIFSIVKNVSLWESYGLAYILDQRHRVFKWVGFQKSLDGDGLDSQYRCRRCQWFSHFAWSRKLYFGGKKNNLFEEIKHLSYKD